MVLQWSGMAHGGLATPKPALVAAAHQNIQGGRGNARALLPRADPRSTESMPCVCSHVFWYCLVRLLCLVSTDSIVDAMGGLPWIRYIASQIHPGSGVMEYLHLRLLWNLCSCW